MFFALLSLILIILLFLIMNLSNKYTMNLNKMSSFECGFDPYLPPRNPFSIQFFKILLIFIMFDMEIIIILPMPLYKIYNNLMMNIILFLMITLIMGLYFEWKEGSLNWIKS